MSATVRDIAKRLGVSTATVSRALRGLPNVTPSTREKVLAAAKELNYSLSARIPLETKQNIGIMMPLADSWIYSKLAAFVETTIIEEDYYTTRYNISSLDNQTEQILWLASRHFVDGLIIGTTALSQKDINILEGLRIPIITIETQTNKFSSFCIDNVKAAKSATQHLINLGHTDIAIISGLKDDPLHFSVPQERLKGYKKALEENNIDFRPELEVVGNFSLEGGAEAMVNLLSIHRPPTAVFAMSDEMAIGALKIIKEMNLRVPEDISIIGFDDHDIAKYFDLTTIKQPIEEFGEKSGSLMLDMLKNNQKIPPINVEFETQLLIRETTGPKKTYSHQSN